MTGGLRDLHLALRMEREAEGRLRWLTPEDATRLLAACEESRNGDLTDLVEFALFTGLRRGEVLDLNLGEGRPRPRRHPARRDEEQQAA
jgi:integrase